eukprot:2298315-Pleurochrysis_carterae.AAC.4
MADVVREAHVTYMMGKRSSRRRPRGHNSHGTNRVSQSTQLTNCRAYSHVPACLAHQNAGGHRRLISFHFLLASALQRGVAHALLMRLRMHKDQGGERGQGFCMQEPRYMRGECRVRTEASDTVNAGTGLALQTGLRSHLLLTFMIRLGTEKCPAY